MAKYALNFAVTVWVTDDNINVGESGDDVTGELTDNQWNSLVSDALNVMEIGGENLDSIVRLDDDDDD